MATLSNSTLLVGPPEARQIQIDASTNQTNTQLKSLTENSSPTFVSSGDPCLDFFFQIVPNSDVKTITSLLSLSWSQEPLTALKLLCNLRGVRGTGKSDREGFYTSALWLFANHPKTLALNAGPISDFGYLKDLPEILHRIVNGGVSTRTKPRKIKSKFGHFNRGFFNNRANRRSLEERLADKKKMNLSSEDRIKADLEKGKALSEEAARIRRVKRVEKAKRAVEFYNKNPNYRLLHDSTADLFASLLAKDLTRLDSEKYNSHISLASKWCPSLDSPYDRSTLLCEAIARRLFPKDSINGDLSDEHYAYRARERLRKEVLVPLRRALQLPEVYIGRNDWGSIPYNRVASVAMKNYKSFFLKYDKERFETFLDDVREGKEKISAGALLPHEILASDDDVADLQWSRMVNDLISNGKLKNSIAVCDVSGSMYGTPMEVCVALGLLVSELSEEPWKGRVITFSERPQLHSIKGQTIKEKTKFITRMDWGMNTDLQKVFDKILEVALQSHVSTENMIKRVFVFSDMEFDQASSRPWETDYEAITRKYEENGYGDSVPEVVFWNLRESRSVPVMGGQRGVALVSGFSKNLFKLFLDGDGVVNPREVMEQAISGKEYQKLKVFD